MRVAHIANRIVPVPPVDFGGIERFLYPLLLKQVEQGLEVTLFCTTGSHIEGVEIVPLADPRKNRDFTDYLAMSISQAGKACERIRQRGGFDLVHDHTGFAQLFAGTLPCPMVVTLHNGLTQAQLFGIDWTDNVTYVAISQSEVSILRGAGIPVRGSVYYAVDTSRLVEQSRSLQKTKEKRLVWIGRVGPDKGPDLAIQVALQTGYKLDLAGFPPEDQYLDWYQSAVEPYLDGETIRYVGTINDAQKPEFFSGASAFVMSNRCYAHQWGPAWNEPFGVVLIEALACGTPVLGTRGGSLPEIVVDKGILVPTTSDGETIANMVSALGQLDVPEEACRQRAMSFTMENSVAQFQRIYQSVLNA